MAPRLSYQASLLQESSLAISTAARGLSKNPASVRLQILEAVAALFGGFDIDWYWSQTRCLGASRAKIKRIAEVIAPQIVEAGIHPALALAVLASPDLDIIEQRKVGSYFTDFRLAHYLVKHISRERFARSTIIDPACGSGILLVAAAIHAAGNDQKKITQLFKSQIVGIDRDPAAIRAARLALSCLTRSKPAIRALIDRLIVEDSLLSAEKVQARFAPKGFGIVLSNPPWEKLKVTRHEFLAAKGFDRHYGAEYKQRINLSEFARQQVSTYNYSKIICEKYDLSSAKEVDLYFAFAAMCLNIAGKGGEVGLVVPAGFIRSQSTEDLRFRWFTSTDSSKISIFDNRANYFAIDTRFKFLTLHSRKTASKRGGSISVLYPKALSNQIVDGECKVSFSLASLSRIRPDLSVPEVKNQSEWRLFSRVATNNLSVGQWGRRLGMEFCREIDMSRDRALFGKSARANFLPLIEGRMVHQFTSTAKSYSSGTGRRAEWLPNTKSNSLRPQFWINPRKIPARLLARTRQERVGFCDITGQTNERSMLTAMIPANVICGNKVPTITFKTDNDMSSRMFVAVANSIAFDWLLRRVMTTTVNYFILDSVPFPAIKFRSPLATRLAQLAILLNDRGVPLANWDNARLRAEIESLVARAYGLSTSDLEIMLRDFPLLDRAEPPIYGESRSTVTRDFILLTYAENQSESSATEALRNRVSAARALGAVPFRPSHLVGTNTPEKVDETDALHTPLLMGTLRNK